MRTCFESLGSRSAKITFINCSIAWRVIVKIWDAIRDVHSGSAKSLLLGTASSRHGLLDLVAHHVFLATLRVKGGAPGIGHIAKHSGIGERAARNRAD